MRSFVGSYICLVVVHGSGGGGVNRLDAFVVVVNYLFRIVHAAVTDLDGISVEDFSELVISGKVLVYHGEEFVSDVGADALAKRRVVPEDVNALSVSHVCLFRWFIP